MLESATRLRQHLLEHESARRPRALAVSLRSGNLKRILQELPAIAIVRDSVRGDQADAFAR